MDRRPAPLERVEEDRGPSQGRSQINKVRIFRPGAAQIRFCGHVLLMDKCRMGLHPRSLSCRSERLYPHTSRLCTLFVGSKTQSRFFRVRAFEPKSMDGNRRRSHSYLMRVISVQGIVVSCSFSKQAESKTAEITDIFWDQTLNFDMICSSLYLFSDINNLL